MFCIRSDVITLRSIEMYGLVTVWTILDDGPYWVTLLMYGSHDMRHTGFRRLTIVNGTPGFWGVTTFFCSYDFLFNINKGTKTQYLCLRLLIQCSQGNGATILDRV